MIAAVRPFLGPERRHEDEPGDRRADVRDHVEQAGDHAERDGVARAEEPGGHALGRPGDRRDHDQADRPARDGGRHLLPHPEPALVLARHQHARQRTLQAVDIGEQEEADEEHREAGEEDAEEAAGDPEHGARSRRAPRRRSCPRPPARSRPAPLAPSHESSPESRSDWTSAGRSWRKSRTPPTSGTSRKSASSTTATAVPSTVTVAARPRDQPVFAITNRTGYSNTSARKIPMKTTRNVSPIARNAATSPTAATTSRIVLIGKTTSTRRRSSSARFLLLQVRRHVPPQQGMIPATRAPRGYDVNAITGEPGVRAVQRCAFARCSPNMPRVGRPAHARGRAQMNAPAPEQDPTRHSGLILALAVYRGTAPDAKTRLPERPPRASRRSRRLRLRPMGGADHGGVTKPPRAGPRPPLNRNHQCEKDWSLRHGRPHQRRMLPVGGRLAIGPDSDSVSEETEEMEQ